MISNPTQLPAWQSLQQQAEALQNQSLRTLFGHDAARFKQFSRHYEQLLVDFSKQWLTAETFELLLDLARQAEVPAAIEQLFSGQRINHTEQRPVLHMALRQRSAEPFLVDGQDVMPEVRQVLEQMRRFADKVRSGAWTGYTGKPIRTVVNIGIGGSDLGPKLVCQALRPYGAPLLQILFLSSIDGAHAHHILRRCDPETTLFIIASKTFTTQETMTNATTAREWLLAALGHEAAVAKHFVAVSTNLRAVQAFGIDPSNMFVFWDWVGGRYSLWSAIGLSSMIYLGHERFYELLDGAHSLDQHFRTAPLADNLPVILALLGVWNGNFLDANSHVVLVYDDYLRSLPSYLQQLDMESNGKSIDRQGEPVTYRTGPMVWGGLGNNGQHAFYQLLHQGTHRFAADFLAPVNTTDPMGEHHSILLANCLAQSQALMTGRTADEARAELSAQGVEGDALEKLLPYKIFPGNRCSTTILYQSLTPRTLGALLALYEHKVFVQGVIWNINSFDQWGVELGKQLTKSILPELQGRGTKTLRDSSTQGLIDYCRQQGVQ